MDSSCTSANRFVRPQVECLEERCLLSNAQFVNALYNDLLHRAPAPAEVTSWTSALQAGANPTQVALTFATSPEYLNNLIQADYRTYLGRQASPVEVAGWQAQLNAGLGENQLQAAFLGSSEYFADHGNAITPWLNGVYHDVLGRAADAAGLSSLSQSLQAGTTRGMVALAMVTSPEAFSRLVSAAYQDLLGRAPDSQGQMFWVSQLQRGLTPSQLLADFATSPEFIAAVGGLNAVAPVLIFPVPEDTFVPTPFIGLPFGGGFVSPTTTGFTSGFTGGGFTGGGFTSGGFSGGFSGGSS